MKEKIIFIVGPTASGKTGLAIELAKEINAEIISADSMQIYQGISIGTAKVTEKEMQGIPHHLIDCCKITDSFSVADFQKLCYQKIEEILSRKKKVIIVGGTGLYVSAIVNHMEFTEEKVDLEYRKKLEKLAIEHSNEYIYQLLEQIDPITAKTIHPNNLKRVIRALEIAKNANDLKSIHMEKEEKRKKELDVPYEYMVFYIDHEREKLYERINQRVDIMIKEGILEEAKKIFQMNLDASHTCMQAIGYKEFFPYFRGESTLEDAILKLKQETRRYAKRQMTWFKNQLNLIYLDGKKNTNELTNEIINKIND